MKNKFFLFFSIIIISLVLCSCATLNITCQIDKQNTAKMSIDLTIPTENMSENERINTTASVNRMVRHLNDKGYEAKSEKNTSEMVLTAVKSKQCSDAQSALSTLVGFMSDASSPFAQVESGYSASFFSDIYNLNAKLDLSNIISDEFLDSLTPSNKEIIETALNETTGSVTFDLWGETVQYTGSLEENKNSEIMSLTQPISISRAIKLYNTENINEHEGLLNNLEMLQAEKGKYTLAIQVAISAATFIILLSLVVLIRRKTNNNEDDRNILGN